jgi:hypothetical protein
MWLDSESEGGARYSSNLLVQLETRAWNSLSCFSWFMPNDNKLNHIFYTSRFLFSSITKSFFVCVLSFYSNSWRCCCSLTELSQKQGWIGCKKVFVDFRSNRRLNFYVIFRQPTFCYGSDLSVQTFNDLLSPYHQHNRLQSHQPRWSLSTNLEFAA